MIPKTIHYCWFGGNKLPTLAEKCIESWKIHCPDYEIIEWNEGNFDIEQNRYAKEAYESKKYAFVSDFARLKILYVYGGIYLDTDVEVIRSLSPFLDEPAFSGYESEKLISTGILGAQKGNPWIEYLLSYYDDALFFKKNGDKNLTTNVATISKLTQKKYGITLNNRTTKIDKELTIYPKDYFCPKDQMDGRINITENTYAIHHFAGSWLDKIEQDSLMRAKKLTQIFGTGLGTKINAVIYNYGKSGVRGVLRKIKKSNRNY